jgi:uncharacterized membrane protein
MGNMKDWKVVYQYSLGAFIVALIAAIVILLIYSTIDASVKDSLLVLLGVLAGAFKEVTGFFFGSSKGSSDKNEMLNKKPL